MIDTYRKAFYLLVSIALFWIYHPVNAGIFYVALSGNDDNPGTFDMPFRTVQQGLNKG